MSQSLLSKITQTSILSQIFGFLSKKRALKITLINQKLSSKLHLSIDEYLLEEEKYRKIILSSKGSVNEICAKAFTYYKESESHLITFPEMVQKMVKYMKYLYIKKVIKNYTIIFEYFFFLYWPHVSFLLEVIRGLNKGISFEMDGAINFKYYDMFKDAISNLEEVHSAGNYPINKITKHNLNSFKFYFNMFDWTKVRCVDFVKAPKRAFEKEIMKRYIYIPDNATFRKIIIDDNTIINCNELAKFMNIHGEHVDYLKIFYLRDSGVDKSFFKNLRNIRKVKLIKTFYLSFYNFLVFFKKYLSQIKILFLDNIFEGEFDNLSERKNYFYLLQNVLPHLNHLEKLKINFSRNSNVSKIYKLLLIIISQNPDLKELKISIVFPDKKTPEKNDKSSAFMKNFLGKELDTEENNLKEFYSLIKEISALKKLMTLQLNFKLDDNMTQIINTFLNVGENLKNLAMIHTRKLNVTHLLNLHPNLRIINFCLDEKDKEDTKMKFNYEFSQRPWTSITLKNYPLNNSFIEALIKAKNTLHDLTLENSFNVCEKSTDEVSNILLALKNNMNN